jgi:hypothetical protein
MPLSEKEERLLAYIRRYVQTAKACCAVLCAASGHDITQTYNWRSQTVLARTGKVNGLTYAFHGRGCLFKTKGVTLDVDFDTVGGCSAFDVWRLRGFLEENYPEETYWVLHLQEGLAQLLQQQQLHQVQREYDEHFYYLGAAPNVQSGI